MKAAAILPLAVALAIYVLSTAGAATTPMHCRLAAFRPFAAAVWDAPWQRGAPKVATIHAAHRRIECAPPKHRRPMQRDWRRQRGRYYARRRHCLSGPTFAGPVSTFGPPAEGAGLTALGVSSADPGIALRSSATLGATFRLDLPGRRDYVRQTDWGPASWTGRAIDITGAEAAQLGGVRTDEPGSAKLIPGDCI